MNSVGTPREVGYLPLILTARKQQTLTLTKRQADIIAGSILGDAYVHPLGKIQFEHSAKQVSYLQWQFEELQTLAYSAPRPVSRTNQRNGMVYTSYRFWLRQYFRPWRDLFYDGKQKVIPKGLAFTPLMMAVWYMDDGSYSDKTCVISAESFKATSLEVAQGLFQDQFGIKTLVRSNGKLLVRSESTNNFFAIIEPYIHASMRYKLP